MGSDPSDQENPNANAIIEKEQRVNTVATILFASIQINYRFPFPTRMEVSEALTSLTMNRIPRLTILRLAGLDDSDWVLVCDATRIFCIRQGCE